MNKNITDIEPQEYLLTEGNEGTDINKQIKKWGRNNICPKHKVKYKKCCIPELQKYHHSSEKELRFFKLLSELMSQFDLCSFNNSFYKSFGYAGKVRDKITLMSSWGSVCLKISYPSDGIRYFEHSNLFTGNYDEVKPINFSEDMIELKEIYVKKEHRFDGLGTKVLTFLKSLCDKYSFSLYVISGSIDYSPVIYNHNINKEIKNIEEIESVIKTSKRGFLAELNKFWWDSLAEIVRTQIKVYENSISPDMIKEDPTNEFYDDDSFRTYNDLQIKDSSKITSWYSKNGFVPTLNIIGNWLFLKVRDSLNTTTVLAGGDMHMIYWNPKHLETMKKYQFVNLRTGSLEDTYSYESTIKYVEYILEKDRTDLIFNDLDSEKVHKLAS